MSTSVLERPPQQESAAPASVRATLNYLRYTGQRPRNYTYDPPDGTPRSSHAAEPHEVEIRNGRLAEAAGLTLDGAGFGLYRQASALADTDFADAQRVRDIYYPEASQLLVAATGASKIVVFDHTLRDSSVERGTPALREPARRVHDDQTFTSGPRRVRDHLPAAEAEQRLQRRFAIINLWRPIGHAVEQAPLAMCDARSIAPEDLVPGDLVYPDKVGETYSFRYNPVHRWYYYPQLRPEEYLLLKIFDSATDGTARLTAHTAFDDPTTPTGAEPRRSIELRALVFWEQ